MYLQTVLIRLNIVVNGSFLRDKFENLCGVLETCAALYAGTPHIARGRGGGGGGGVAYKIRESLALESRIHL